MLLIVLFFTNVLAYEFNSPWQPYGNNIKIINSNNLEADGQNYNFNYQNNFPEDNNQLRPGNNPGDYNQNQNHQSVVNENVEVTNPLIIPVFKHIGVPYQHRFEIQVPHAMPVGVPQPYPVHVPVPQAVAYPVIKTIIVPVEKKIPFEVERIVPVPVEKPVPIAVEKPIPVPVEQPYPIHIPIYKNVYHRKVKGRSSRSSRSRNRTYKG
ncbi:hypothetical protein KQX54_001725 [Cotesia glomerata]|uniref:Uncharacterized protein n=1 Tax=Cotesia glomerata TaxID=32391 RepID=A0AAV7ILS7_COTGL|nr:hypothetical protein KQX54_001725 [Cotesia glomerata]